MSKWTLVRTNALGFGDQETKEQKARRMRKFDNMIRNTKVKTEEELKKDADKAFRAEQERKDALVAAYDAKKLKSKDAIKEARAIKRKKNNKKADSALEAAMVQSHKKWGWQLNGITLPLQGKIEGSYPSRSIGLVA